MRWMHGGESPDAVCATQVRGVTRRSVLPRPNRLCIMTGSGRGVLEIPRTFLYNRRMPQKLTGSSQRANPLETLAEPLTLLELFEFLPQVYMYVKDRDGRYVRANRVACDVMGLTPHEVIGKTDFDIFPPAIATQYVAEDRRVIESAKPLTDQVWLVPGPAGVPRWYLCNKIPLLDAQGHVLGIAGVKRPYEQAGHAPAGYARLLKVVELVTTHYHEPLDVPDLANHVNLSVSQLQREFSRLFGITPVQYIREVRIGVARHLLESDGESMAQISAACGFYDQSHFTRQFKASTGMTPLEYRRRFSPGSGTKRSTPSEPEE